MQVPLREGMQDDCNEFLLAQELRALVVFFTFFRLRLFVLLREHGQVLVEGLQATDQVLRLQVPRLAEAVLHVPSLVFNERIGEEVLEKP